MGYDIAQPVLRVAFRIISRDSHIVIYLTHAIVAVYGEVRAHYPVVTTNQQGMAEMLDLYGAVVDDPAVLSSCISPDRFKQTAAFLHDRFGIVVSDPEF